ncbi:MAG TPA: response regulator transcription factor [Pirellulaceae bacterium]
METTLIIADDHPIVRSGLRRLLEGSRVQVLAEVETADQAVERTVALRPRVLLLDVRLGDDDGFSVLEKVRDRAPDVAVVVISAFAETTYMARALVWGAVDYLLKDCTTAELTETIERATRHEPPGPRSLLASMRALMRTIPDHNGSIPEISPREAQVLRHLGLGLSNREIGLSLGIAVDTVKEHAYKAMRKLSLRDRTEAAVWVVKQGWLDDLLNVADASTSAPSPVKRSP